MAPIVRTRAFRLAVFVALVARVGAGAQEASAPLGWLEGSSTLVVLPDTERYSDDYPELFRAQTSWIRRNAARRRIAFAIHLGDITQHGAEAEWRVASEAFELLEPRVPYALALGNHDYHGSDRATRAAEFFPLERLRRQPTFGGVLEPARIDNSYHLFSMGGRDWLLLMLEFGPREKTIAWADRILREHRSRLAIIVTHAYLFRGNVRYDHLRGRQRASPHGWGADGEELWQKLVRRHPQVMLVLSGHVSSGGTGHLASEGDYGNTVHQIMADYEKSRRGGSGYLRLLEFLPDGKSVQVKTYSPALNRHLTDGANQFRFSLKEADRSTPRVAKASSGVPLERAPAHRWSFDGRGGDGARAADSIGDADAVLRAAGSGSRLSGRGEAVLEGAGRVALPAGLLEGLEDASFEVWFTPEAEKYRWQSAVRFGEGRDWFGYIFRTLTVHRAEIAVDGHNEDIQRTVPAKPGTRMHVVVTYDHDGADGRPLLSYYRDGEPYGTLATGLRLGDVDDGGSGLGPLAGRFDELRLYDRALTPGEVRGSFRAGPDRVRVKKR